MVCPLTYPTARPSTADDREHLAASELGSATRIRSPLKGLSLGLRTRNSPVKIPGASSGAFPANTFHLWERACSRLVRHREQARYHILKSSRKKLRGIGPKGNKKTRRFGRGRFLCYPLVLPGLIGLKFVRMFSRPAEVDEAATTPSTASNSPQKPAP